MSKDFQNAVAIIAKHEEKFVGLVSNAGTTVDFKTEMLYASQLMMNNDYLCKVALTNPLSLRNAFSQVAASGLTLNPSRGFAYLVPRDGQVILDISWRGMVKAAVNDGAIKDCIVEVVYSGDKFEYRGKRVSPVHTFNPFDKKEKRGDFIGAYVEALLPDGRIHVEAISSEEIYAAREASELWSRKKKGPWVDFFVSMVKKTAIKIARKYWPQTSHKLDEAIQYLNVDGKEGFTSNDVPLEVVERFMGNAEVVSGEPEPLPTSNEQSQQEAAPEPQPTQAASQEPAREVQGEVMPSEPAKPTDTTADLPAKVVNKVDELIKRASNQGCWAAAREYVDSWPVEARDYAQRKLKAAEYAQASGG